MDDSSLMRLNLLVVRLTMVLWLFGWYVKAIFLLPYFFFIVPKFPIYHDAFPLFFTSVKVSAIFYSLPILSVPAIVKPTKNRLVCASILFIICSLVLMVHINSYNDATFVTSFWVAIWTLWLSLESHRTDGMIRQQACFLARLVLGMVFLGGFVGKLTPQYLSGEAFYHIFWVESSVWPHQWLITKFSADQLLNFSRYFSWMIIMIELFLACSVFYKSWKIYIIAPLLMCGFMITNTWAILSVLSCLIGMMLACLMYKRIDKIQGIRYA